MANIKMVHGLNRGFKMSKEESTNKQVKAIYLRQNMGQTRLFKPHNECSARFLKFCNSETEILKHEFYGAMCRPCMTEAIRIHEKALNAPAKPVKSWSEISTGSSEFSRLKYGSGGDTKTLKRKQRSDKKCQE